MWPVTRERVVSALNTSTKVCLAQTYSRSLSLMRSGSRHANQHSAVEPPRCLYQSVVDHALERIPHPARSLERVISHLAVFMVAHRG
jgi:hypothetical protein